MNLLSPIELLLPLHIVRMNNPSSSKDYASKGKIFHEICEGKGETN